MSTVRKNPPQPAPSRISGTLKVHKPVVNEVEDEASAASARELTPRGEAAKNAERGTAERPRGGRAGAAGGRSERPTERSTERSTERPRPERKRAESAANGSVPAKRGRSAAAGTSTAGKAGDRSDRSGRAGRSDNGQPNADTGARRKAHEGRGDSAAPRARSTPAASAMRPAPATHPAPLAQTAEPPTGVRLSKVMAERGICSRREADEFIERGWVFVDGKRVSELGIRIDPDARIDLAPEATRTQRQRVTILLHKPVGYVSGQPEPGYTPAASLIGADNQFDRDSAQRFHGSHLMSLAPAGRLDIDSTGLLVLTQDGRIARRLIGDDSKVDKEYLVRVDGHLDAEGLALLQHGLELDGVRLRPARVEWINDDQLRFELREGRKRQIRRMCELVGLKVLGLKRVRIGQVKLGDLPLGQWRYLREDESF